MKTVTLEVSEPVAEKILRMSPVELKAISDTLERLLSNRKTLDEIMKEASEQARANGLTPEILKTLLDE